MLERQSESFVDKLTKKGVLPVLLIRCNDHDGRACFFLMRFKSEMDVNRLNKASKLDKHQLNLEEYGMIISRGFGSFPNADEQKRVKNTYGIDVNELFS